MIEVGHPGLSITTQCELVGLSRSSFYYEAKGESAQNLELMRLIDEQYTRTPFYGSPKMTEWLRTQKQRHRNSTHGGDTLFESEICPKKGGSLPHKGGGPAKANPPR
jgi:hypothetical protein